MKLELGTIRFGDETDVVETRLRQLLFCGERLEHRSDAERPPIPAEPNLPAIYRGAFACLWAEIHGPDSWDANPEVVALTFRVVRANIDSAEARTP